jgi:hypothetical protein
LCCQHVNHVWDDYLTWPLLFDRKKHIGFEFGLAVLDHLLPVQQMDRKLSDAHMQVFTVVCQKMG